MKPEKPQKPESPWLGLDYGTKFCGLAFSPDGLTMVPLEVVPVAKIESKIGTIFSEKKIRTLIVGLPLSWDDKENEMSVRIQKLTKKLAKKYPVIYINEWNSSQSVTTFRQNKSKNQRHDDFAAVNILEFLRDRAFS